MAMFALHGDGVSSGIVIGKAKLATQHDYAIATYVLKPEDVLSEVKMLQQAVETVKTQLRESLHQLGDAQQEELSAFLSMHLTMLDDHALLKQAYFQIEHKYCNAQNALLQQQRYWIEKFAEFDDAYLRSKLQDTTQILNLIQAQLTKVEEAKASPLEVLDEGGDDILIADDISPADAMQLRQSAVKAFLTRFGSVVSHTAILAKSMHIPAVVGLQDGVRTIQNGDKLIVDGRRGVIIVNPDAGVIESYAKRRDKISRRALDIEKWRDAKAVTLDNQSVVLNANLDMLEDLQAVLYSRAQEIGLLRTEMLYLQSAGWPSESQQYDYYKQIITRSEIPVTIRTFDIGADKALHSIINVPVLNPALGLRAVRLGLRHEEQLRIQIRAILRAGVYGHIKILLPMVTNVAELQQIRRIIQEVQHELQGQGVAYNAHYQIGIMVEVPAAALNIDLFAPYVDFFSIGTNDLIQYTLAIDRGDDDVNYLYDPLHPAVLRLLKMVINTAIEYNKPVSMCGEMASNPLYTPLLLWMGLREFSMEPSAITEIKRVVCLSDITRISRQLDALFYSPEIGAINHYLQQIQVK